LPPYGSSLSLSKLSTPAFSQAFPIFPPYLSQLPDSFRTSFRPITFWILGGHTSSDPSWIELGHTYITAISSFQISSHCSFSRRFHLFLLSFPASSIIPTKSQNVPANNFLDPGRIFEFQPCMDRGGCLYMTPISSVRILAPLFFPREFRASGLSLPAFCPISSKVLDRSGLITS